VPLPEPGHLARTEQTALRARTGQEVGVLLGEVQTRSENPRGLGRRRGRFT